VVKFALLGWVLLTAGIVSGSIWAYMELGWGGYWSWDPIETTALATWLLLSAYIHLINRKKSSGGRVSFIFISAVVFSILFGTFIARSGVLNSIHSYSSQANKSFFLLTLVIVVIVCFLISIFVFYKRGSGSKVILSGGSIIS
jgi:cytochrome c-type biogenesis protein CcmF